MQTQTKSIVVGLLSLFLLGCDGRINSAGGDDGGGGGGGSDTDAGTPINQDLVGAGDRDLLADWPSINLPFSDNTKMLNFVQLRNEVQRATTMTWVDQGVDQWTANQSILGGADFVESWQYDISPNQQKMLTIRRMAFRVCGDLVASEQGQATRTVFGVVDPAVAIDAGAASTQEQVRALFKRFFFEEIEDQALTDSLSLLSDLQGLDGQEEAWRGLCTAYLSSMRFLSY